MAANFTRGKVFCLQLSCSCLISLKMMISLFVQSRNCIVVPTAARCLHHACHFVSTFVVTPANVSSATSVDRSLLATVVSVSLTNLLLCIIPYGGKVMSRLQRFWPVAFLNGTSDSSNFRLWVFHQMALCPHVCFAHWTGV